MPKLFSLIGLAMLITISVVAQKNPSISKDEILERAPDKTKAKKELSKAKKYYKKGEGTYDEALKYYLRLYNYNDSNDALNYKIGACYLWSSDKKASLAYLQECKPQVAKDYYFLLGKAFQYNYRFSEAREAFETYFESLNKWNRKEKLERLMQLKRECNFGRVAVKDSTPVFIYNMGPVVNTYYDEYGAIYMPKDSSVVYTSRRPLRQPNQRVSRFMFDEQILQAPMSLYADASLAYPISGLKRSVSNAVAGYNTQQDLLYFYKGKRRTGEIYSAKLKNYKAKKSKSLNHTVNHIAYKETSISVDDNGIAYFVSDRRGGEGAKDIWVCVNKKKNRFKKRRNIGAGINTPFDEECVYVTPDGNTLYFSSNGHDGMGGFDVYRCQKQESGSWGKPVNLGHPINSPADELFYRPTDNPDIALYSTMRGKGYGGLDIYKIINDNRIPFTLSGIITDVASFDTLQASIQVFDADASVPVASSSTDSVTFKYLASFEDVAHYLIQVDAEGYETLQDTISCPDTRHAEVEMNFQLKKLKSPFTVSGYVRDSATYAPLKATINCYDAEVDTLLTRQISNEFNGKYSFTLADKYLLRIEVVAENYFALTDSLNAKEIEEESVVRKFDLVSSKTIYSLFGTVKSEEGEAVDKASVYLYKDNKHVPFAAVVTNTEGFYSLQVEEEGTFIVDVKCEGYFFLTDTVNVVSDSLKIKYDFILDKMKVGAKIVVKNILFNSGKSSLKPESFPELDKMADLLKENGDIRIEVSGHTDNVGSAAINKKISKSRALTVRNYLINNGVEEDRLEYKGYGLEQPIAPNSTAAGKAQNRRVEIKVLE